MSEPIERTTTLDGDVVRHRTTPWDARDLGIATVELTAIQYTDPDRLPALLDAFDAACIADQIGLATTRISAGDLALKHQLQRAGFHYVETSHPLRLERLAGRDFGRTVPVEAAAPEDAPAIAALARDAFEFSRFHEDGRIHPARARARLAGWIMDSFTNGDEILVHRRAGAIAAVMTYRVNDDAVTLHLGGTRPEIGPVAAMFWPAVLGHLRDRNLRVIDTRVSAANIPAIRLHLALGFVPLGTDLGFTRLYPAGAIVSSPP